MASNTRDPGPPQSFLTPSQIFWYSLANFGYGTFFSLNNALIAPFLSNFTKNAILMGLMGSTHSFEGAIIQPLVGTASDRLRHPFGKRRPFILLFTPLSALFLALTPAATHLPSPIRLSLLVLLIFLSTVLFNIAYDPYQALMPDITPEPQRGRVTAIWSLFGLFGQATILLMPGDYTTKFLLSAALMIVLAVLTCMMIPEPSPLDAPEGDIETPSFKQQLVRALRGLRVLRQARLGLLGFFFAGLGIGAVLPLLTEFVIHITHCTANRAAQMFLILMASTALAVVPAGQIADRVLTPKKTLLVGFSLIFIACLCGLRVTTLTQIAWVMGLAGIGNAALSASSYPLLADIVPPEEVGFYVGLQSTAASLAQPLTIVITGALVNHGSYRVIFLVCALCILAALLSIALLRPSAAKQEIQQHRALAELKLSDI
ncbi:MFS/sugar transport protein [Chthonomonas calidirosea]|uniref:MFS transporter n=1 Tax=Chthonomonas calidirosea TaxID=454171 RepID=UPI0006DD4D15|nr:MFS transporter [Chthonomonas calidirosea]CEK12519.1 MFS/sugar transport protein [Chthonomonas calidirosea]